MDSGSVFPVHPSYTHSIMSKDGCSVLEECIEDYDSVDDYASIQTPAFQAAQDQMARGGYSVVLVPEYESNTTWFSRGTIERKQKGQYSVKEEADDYAASCDHAAKHAHTLAVESPIDDNATTLGQLNAGKLSAGKLNCKQVAWRPEDEFELKNIFKGKGSERLSEMLTEVRNKRKCPSWIGENAWKWLHKTWNNAPYKLKSAQAKQNRASAKGGSVHTGGSISTKEHVIRMRRELGREPTFDEVFLRTHTKKKDSSWVDERAKKTYYSGRYDVFANLIIESFQEKVKDVSQVGQTSGSGIKEVDAATRLKLWAESAGGKKWGLLYGAGDMSKHYKPGVSSLTQAYSTQVATNSSVEITAQIEVVVQRANAAEEDARVAREECQRANQRTENLERQI
ncbi:hypothetical protein TSUD_34260 [Trifolium subterraneum]|uniref:Transposase, Ptta/En/Spm, plant n=1 Tax=Trifolium subterraneum TaxID=3900 RepID=A0A2Z6P2U9_TRISU|nr:hypothetical protein TSUD_34260 [Trifolium subterraneum]